jgi:L-aspartate oxidase
MVRALLDRAQRTARLVRLFCSVDLVVAGGVVAGRRFPSESGGNHRDRAPLLATAGRDGLRGTPTLRWPPATAWPWPARGAALLDMEFVRFHPTRWPAPRFLVSEAVRGEGASCAPGALHGGARPRDQVARAIARENRAGRGPVTLDLRHLDPDHIRSRFPRIAATCARYGVDLTQDPVPVTPAAHYVMGGVATDLSGRSTLPGLYAAGEAAGTGVHGANRLASNSLLEGLVFGARAAEAMAADPAPLAVAARPDMRPP